MKNGDVICEEHGTCLGDPDLIEAIMNSDGMTREEWDALPEEEQHALQIGWVSPPVGYLWLGEEGHPCAR